MTTTHKIVETIILQGSVELLKIGFGRIRYAWGEYCLTGGHMLRNNLRISPGVSDL